MNWIETNKKTYHYQLECVPPAAGNGRRAFACGEPLRTNEQDFIYQVFVYCCGRYFTAERPLREFDTDKYANEVFQQFFTN